MKKQEKEKQRMPCNTQRVRYMSKGGNIERHDLGTRENDFMGKLNPW